LTRHLLKLVWKRKRGNALVIVEILCSFLVLFAVLTFGSAMLMRYQRPLGFDYRDVWNVRLDYQSDQGTPEQNAQRWSVIERMMSELHAMPQVESASLATMGAFGNGAWTRRRRARSSSIAIP
jgi:putative ABC transport system permease protein